MVLGVLLLLHCSLLVSLHTTQLLFPTHINIHAADTENSRGFGLACAHLWHTNGDGLLAAAEVNWRATCANEVLAAILVSILCKVVKLQVGGARAVG
jgi:hypothetical protein